MYFYYKTLSDQSLRLNYPNDKYQSKKILFIGDSQTASNYFPYFCSKYLKATTSIHAMGSINAVEMVDGFIPSIHNNNADPSLFGVNIIKRLTSNDVKDCDCIIIQGFYNMRDLALERSGYVSDIFPEDTTFYGEMNYLIKRLNEELTNANNTKCSIYLASPHSYGKYAYSDNTSNDNGEGDTITHYIQNVAINNNLGFIDLYHIESINPQNRELVHRNTFTKNKTSPFPKNKDQLHLNIHGHLLLALEICNSLLKQGAQ